MKASETRYMTTGENSQGQPELSDKPFPGQGSVWTGKDGEALSDKSGAGRGKRGGPTAKEVEGKKTGGAIKAKGWGKARSARAAKYY